MAWPIILINFMLAPEFCMHLRHFIPIALIPGLHNCQGIHLDPFRPTSYPFGSIPSSDSLRTHSGPLYLRIHSNSFRSTLILILSSSHPFTTQSGTVLCSPVHSLILLLFDRLCHSAFGWAGSCARSIYSLSYWAKGFLRVFSLDPPLLGMSEWCT